MSVHMEGFIYLKNVPWLDLLKVLVFRLPRLTLSHLGTGGFFTFLSVHFFSERVYFQDVIGHRTRESYLGFPSHKSLDQVIPWGSFQAGLV